MFAQTLVFYDGPQLVLLKSARGLSVIAAAIERHDMAQPFFACEIVERDFNKYMAGKADLHYLFRSAVADVFYFFDLAKGGDNWIEMVRAEPYQISDAYFPDVGFFARSHTELMEGMQATPAASHVFKIDGNWEASDFSRFYNKIEDIYSFVSAMAQITKGAADKTREAVVSSITSHLWHGGGSYVAFYDDLFESVRAQFPLRIGQISYGSPGQIAVRGNAEALSDVDTIIYVFDEHGLELRSRYQYLNGTLAREKLKRNRPVYTPLTHELLGRLQQDAATLATRMRLDPDELFTLCRQDAVVFCKIVFSFYRRANELHMFYKEGRMQMANGRDRTAV